jgi:O-antigen ligase
VKAAVAKSSPDRDVVFWSVVGVVLVGVGLVATRSPLLAAMAAFAIGFMALLTVMIGTRAGSLAIAAALIVVVVDLPEDIALTLRIPVGGGGIFLSDMLLALLVAGWLLSVLASGEIRLVRTPVNLPLCLFLVWAGIEMVAGKLGGNEMRYVLQDMRGLAYYILFFWVVSMVTTWREVRVLLITLATAMMLGFGVGALYAATGRGDENAVTAGTVSRFPGPNEAFLIGALLLGAFLVMWPATRRRPVYLWLFLVVALVGLALSLVRGYWVGLVFGVAVLFLLLRTKQRMVLLAGSVIVLVVMVSAAAVLKPAALASIASRVEAVTAVGDRNVQYRLEENKAVLAQIRARPVQGYGLGKTFVPDFSQWGIPLEPKIYVHNNYLWFMQRLGIVGVVLFAWAMLAFLDPRRWRAAATGDRAWIDGLIVGSRVVVSALLLVSISSPQFNTKGAVTMTAVIMGLAEVVGSRRLDGTSEGLGLLEGEAPPGPASDSG